METHLQLRHCHSERRRTFVYRNPTDFRIVKVVEELHSTCMLMSSHGVHINNCTHIKTFIKLGQSRGFFLSHEEIEQKFDLIPLQQIVLLILFANRVHSS